MTSTFAFASGRVIGVIALSTLCVMAVAACSAQTSPSVDGSLAPWTPSAPAAASTAPAAGSAKALPNAVPLPSGADLVEATKPLSSGGATGWTAVAVTPVGTSLTPVASQLNQSLTQSGWASKLTGTEADGFVLAAGRTYGAQQQWLNINVTTPVPGSGPAITYRFATALSPTKSPSAGASR